MPKLTARERAEAVAAQELLVQNAIRSDFEAWCRYALLPFGQEPATHHLRIIDELTSVSDGDHDRLLITLPPGHAKSQYASILFPIWWIAQHPHTQIIGASYGSDLAEQFSGKIRLLIEEHAETLGFGLVKGSNARDFWQTTNGCTYRAVGAGGAITGTRADVLILDDAVKGRAEAESETARSKLWDWYRSDFYTRLKPTGRIVAIGTRWHEDDLLGRLINGEGEPWRVLDLPAICDSEQDELGREIGDALWPDWMPVEKLERIRSVIGERDFSALYQCRPTTPDGNLFRVDHITFATVVPPDGQVVRYWDLAATASATADWTVGLKLLRTSDGGFIVLDVVRFRAGPEDVVRRIREVAEADGIHCRVGLPIDPGAAGKTANLYLTRNLTGFRVESTRESGSKETRAMPVAAQVNGHNVQMVQSRAWNDVLTGELAVFPSGRHDDIVDALSGAFSMLMVPAVATRFVPYNLMGR